MTQFTMWNPEAETIRAGGGDKLTVEECLYAMLLESSNPAANALAEHTSGSINRFVYEMNEKADELGCRHSRFQNPSGLNDETQTTTAYDMALISCEVFENEDLREICSAQRYQLPPTLISRRDISCRWSIN